MIGPAIIVYLASTTIGGVWWASDLSARVFAMENSVRESADSAKRIVALETIINHIDKQLNKIDDKLDDKRKN